MPVRMMEKSDVAEHAWENHHTIYWEETTVLEHGRGQEPDDTTRGALHLRWRTGSPWLVTVVSTQWIRSWFFHAYSATADFSTIPFLQASQCSLSLISSLCFVSLMQTWPQLQGIPYTTLYCLPCGEVPLTTVMRRQGERSNPHRLLTSNEMYPQQCRATYSNIWSHFCISTSENWSIELEHRQSYFLSSSL